MTSNKQTNSINYNDKESLQKYIKYIESEKKSLEKEKQKLIISPDSDGLIKCIVIFKLFWCRSSRILRWKSYVI